MYIDTSIHTSIQKKTEHAPHAPRVVRGRLEDEGGPRRVALEGDGLDAPIIVVFLGVGVCVSLTQPLLLAWMMFIYIYIQFTHDTLTYLIHPGRSPNKAQVGIAAVVVRT